MELYINLLRKEFKKVRRLFYLVLCLVLMPILVYANMGAPDITPYQVIITNPNGAALYNSDLEVIDTIAYDTIVTIIYEETINGKLYGTVGEYSYVRINLDDTNIYDELDFSKFDDTDGEVYVYKEGCYMYEGPSIKYEKIETEIPVGTILTYSYKDELWIYVTYEGKSGWVYYWPYYEWYEDISLSVADYNSLDQKLYVYEDVTFVYDDPFNNEKISTTINKGTYLDYDYSVRGFTEYINGTYYYIYYNGVSGWVTSNNVAVVANESFITYEEVKLYDENYNDTGVVLPANYEGTYEYSFIGVTESDYVYYFKIMYNNKDYYMIFISTYSGIVLEDNASNTTKVETNIYDVPGKNIIGTVPINTSLNLKYDFCHVDGDNWYYITYGGISGWIKISAFNEVVEQSTNVETETEEETEKVSQNIMTTVTEAIMVIIIIVLASLTTLIYINKKKVSKE